MHTRTYTQTTTPKKKSKGPKPEEVKKLVEEKRRSGAAGEDVDKLDQYIDE